MTPVGGCVGGSKLSCGDVSPRGDWATLDPPPSMAFFQIAGAASETMAHTRSLGAQCSGGCTRPDCYHLVGTGEQRREKGQYLCGLEANDQLQFRRLL